MSQAKAYSAASATSPLAPVQHRRRDPQPTDVQIEILFCGVCHSDLHHVARRVAQRHASLPVRARPRNRRPRDDGRRRGHEVQGGRPRRRRLHGRFLPHLPELPAGPRAVLRPGATSPTTAPTNTHGGRMTYGGYSERIVVDEAFVLRVPDESRPRRGRAAALRRHHHLLAAAPLGRQAGQEGRHRRPRRARPHGREVRPRLRRPHRPLHHFARQRRTTPCASARTRSSSPRTPMR